MELYHAMGIIITLAALFAYINHRFFSMPMSIGLMAMSLCVSLLLLLMEQAGVSVALQAERMLGNIDFSTFLLEGILGLLLFAGALHVNLDDLAEQKLEIGIFSTLSVIGSTLIVGSVVSALNAWLGWGMATIHCYLFGALISPTDPIAVLGIMRRAGASKRQTTQMSGESLFNDGIGVVVFLVLLGIATHHEPLSFQHVTGLFAKEAVGGILFGVVTGFGAYLLLKSINNYHVEIMVTLALVMGGYSLANAFHLSGPLAMVAAGLLIGNHGRRLAMSDETRDHLDTFWELVDEILNALLFVLIGLEVLVLSMNGDYWIAGMMLIPVVLAARLICIGVPVGILDRWRDFEKGSVMMLTWGGLRGGISVALALSLPEECSREVILTITYVVVIFSIMVQGLTISRLVPASTAAPQDAETAE